MITLHIFKEINKLKINNMKISNKRNYQKMFKVQSKISRFKFNIFYYFILTYFYVNLTKNICYYNGININYIIIKN